MRSGGPPLSSDTPDRSTSEKGRTGTICGAQPFGEGIWVDITDGTVEKAILKTGQPAARSVPRGRAHSEASSKGSDSDGPF